MEKNKIKCSKKVPKICSKTCSEKNEKKLDLVVAASYGGRWDIINAVNKLETNKKFISEADITSELSTANFEDPDLCIRTGKEQRISNFLLWQLAYTELYFPDLLWPDFNLSLIHI